MIDKRKAYYLTIDTETANSLEEPLAYDIGFAIHDKKGNVYEQYSLVIYETYVKEKELLKTAYYYNKLPKYEVALKKGERKMVSILTAKKIIKNLCKKYKVKAIIAHNARFDSRALNTTLRYVTKSRYRYFLPYDIPLWDSMKMAQDTLCKQKSFLKFIDKFGLRTPTGRVPSNAQVLYAYITNNPTYQEEHQGLDDVMIEKEITCKCLRQHKAMRKLAWG